MNIIKLNAITSSNTYLKELSKEVDVADELIVLAKEQTAGRGQLGAAWQSQTGKSLTFSVFKRFSGLLVTEQFTIAMAVSLGVQKALSGFNIPATTVKWPNDIMSYQKKLAGVLIENLVEGNTVSATIIGIGLNVNETKFTQLPLASSMKLSSGNHFDLDEVLQCVTSAIFKELNMLPYRKISDLQQEYENLLFKKDVVSVFEDPAQNRFNGKIVGVNKMGQLCVEIDDEQHRYFSLKEIRMCF